MGLRGWTWGGLGEKAKASGRVYGPTIIPKSCRSTSTETGVVVLLIVSLNFKSNEITGTNRLLVYHNSYWQKNPVRLINPLVLLSWIINRSLGPFSREKKVVLGQ